jgi:ABC-type transport system involved in multi-copper enzyme maturation permease subunit
MNRALLVKTARDTTVLLAVTLVAIVLFEILFFWAMWYLAPELLELWSRVAFLKKLFQVLLSIDVSVEVSVNTLIAVGMVHPFLFAVSWALLITTCTRVTVGEIDRGTADLLLSLPVSRAAVFTTTSVVWLAASVLMCLCVLLGISIGSMLFRLPDPLDMGRLAVGAVNLLALYAAIGATTMCVSCTVHRRGVAVAIILAILLFSFLINFLAAFVPLIDDLSFLGFLNYYRPVEIVKDGTWPLGNIAVLACIALVTWSAGLAIFCHKDVPVR